VTRALLRPAADANAYLDAQTGEVVHLTQGWSDDWGFSEADLGEALASGRLVAIVPVPLETQLGWRRAFLASLEDDWPKDALALALADRSPLAAFDAALGRHPAERCSWLACLGGRLQAVLRAWLDASDVVPLNELPPARGAADPA
jgi:hypothetical protein